MMSLYKTCTFTLQWLKSVAYLGGGHGAMSTPFRATINFFQHVIIDLYVAKIMGLLHASRLSRVQRKVRYFIHYGHRDIEFEYESDIDEFGPKNNRSESF